MSIPVQRRSWAVLLTLAVPGAFAGVTYIARLQAASLSVSPDSGPPGSKVTLNGAGFSYVAGGAPAGILWDGEMAGSFDLPKTGSFSVPFTIPKQASPGSHIITVCNQCGSEFEESAGAKFEVTAPPTSTPPPPTSTPPPPSKTPAPTSTLPKDAPTNTPATLLTSTAPIATQQVIPFFEIPIPEAWCGDLGLGPEAVVLDFEENLAVQEARTGVSFQRTGEVITPSVAAHSGTRALRSGATEFGSVDAPITMLLSRPVTALGVFVGLEQALYARGEITAILTAHGYRAGGRDIVLLGQDQVRLPAAPNAIHNCLRVRAAAGEAIVRAELEYRDSSGFSLFEPRLMDDLTLLNSPVEVPEDNRPPTVEIIQPADGATVRAYDYYRAEVDEDRLLRRMWYQVGDSAPVGIAFSRVGGPTRYVATVGIGLQGTGPRAITFGAEDAAGQVGIDTVTVLLPTPPPPVDIEAVAAEAVQVVQCLGDPGCRDNSTALVANKPTIVRLYLRLRSGDVLNEAVRGRLCNVVWSLCVTSLNAVIPDMDPDPVANDRGNINATLNFMMPTHWIPAGFGAAGGVDLEVTVNDRRAVEETDYENNRVQLGLGVVDERRMRVNFYPVSVGSVAAPLSEAANMAAWLERVYPVASLQIVNARSTLTIAVRSLADSSGDGCGRDWNRLMSALDTRRLLDLAGGLVGGDVHYLGMVPQGVNTGGTIGCGNTPGWAAASIITPGQRFGAQVAAQELAHNKGLLHAPGCGADRLDPSYPVSNGTSDVWGLDVARLQVYPPSTTFDYMGYCGSENDTWTSRYTYYNMMRQLPRAMIPTAGSRLAAPIPRDGELHEYRVVAGVIYPDQVDIVSGPYHMLLGEEDGTPPGPYTVELLTEVGEALYRRDFRATPLSNSDNYDTGTFYLTLPSLEGMRTIRFLYQGVEIGRLEASAGVPTVTLLSPVGGEDWGTSGMQTIRWEAQDPDGDPLHFALQASADGGERWTTLALDLESVNEFTLDVADIAGGAYILRVLASDGFHTAEDRTEATVRIGAKLPSVHLMAPEDGAMFPVGELIVFQGFASDREDGVVEQEAYVWTSDIDGELGQGSTLWALPLSPGDHTIALTVTDQEGGSVAESVRIRVLGSTAEDIPRADSETPGSFTQGSLSMLTLILAGLALMALVGGGLLFLALRAMRRR